MFEDAEQEDAESRARACAKRIAEAAQRMKKEDAEWAGADDAEIS